MNKDQLVELAKQADWPESLISPIIMEKLNDFAKLVAQHEQDQFFKRAHIAAELAIERAIELEREECLKICQEVVKYFPSSGFVASFIASKIKERSTE
jgi:hypothetical protein